MAARQDSDLLAEIQSQDRTGQATSEALGILWDQLPPGEAYREAADLIAKKILDFHAEDVKAEQHRKKAEELNAARARTLRFQQWLNDRARKQRPIIERRPVQDEPHPESPEGHSDST
jgi:hypothetical protein